MSFIDWFRPSYRVFAQQSCAGCQARQAHIEDLQNILKSEREGNSILQTVLFQKVGYAPTTEAETIENPKPLKQFQTAAQLRKAVEKRERETFPNARDEYWTKVQAEYDKAGKLPKTETG